VSDTFTPNKNRTERQLRNDAVLQLSNEIADSGALLLTQLKNGDYKATLKLVKKEHGNG
jgi:hypothetical protein